MTSKGRNSNSSNSTLQNSTMKADSLGISSQITFLYFKDLDAAVPFFEDILQLELVENQGWARIYRVSEGAFIGAVDESRGSLKAQDNNAVLITLVIDDVDGWYHRLRGAKGLRVIKEPAVMADIQIKGFFVEGPGGYHFEFQEFMRPEDRSIFHRA